MNEMCGVKESMHVLCLQYARAIISNLLLQSFLGGS